MIVATYNVHCCLGTDGVCNPYRILRALRATNAHLIGLQEVKCNSRINGGDQAQLLAEELDMELAVGSSLSGKQEADGTAILSRLPIEGTYNLNITVPGFQPRSCLFVTLRGPFGNILIANTRLGTSRLERNLQAQAIYDCLIKMVKSIDKLVFLGDFNDWGTTSQVHQIFKHNLKLATTGKFGFPLRSYPTYLPLFPLDRVYCGVALSVIRSFILKNSVTKMASHHYPVVVELKPMVAVKVENLPHTYRLESLAQST